MLAGAKFMTINRQIAEEAADWVVQLDEGDLTGKGNVDLADWLSRSPDHVQEFLLAAALVQVVSDLPEARSEALKRVLGEKADTVIPLMQNEATVEIAKPAARRRMIKIAPIAAAVALLVILAIESGYSFRQDGSPAGPCLCHAHRRTTNSSFGRWFSNLSQY